MICRGNATELTENIRIAHVTCSIILAVAGTIGNGLSISLIFRSPSLRTSPTMMLIIDFCIANMVSTVFTLPVIAASSFFQHWPLNEPFCQAFAFIMYVSLITECLILMTMTISQYLVIVHRVSNNAMLNHHKCPRLSVLLGLPWILTMSVCLIPLIKTWDRFGYDPKKGYCSLLSPSYGFGFLTTMSIALISVMTVVTFYCYAAIFFTNYSSQRKTAAATKTDTSKEKRRNRNAQLTRMITIILINFLVTYLPFLITSTVDPCLRNTSEALYTAIIYISWSHVTTNPAIYALMNHRINVLCCSLFTFGKSNRVSPTEPTNLASSIRDRNRELNSTV